MAPRHAAAEWSLSGQTITAEVPLRATVGALKATLAAQTRLPANKQKLLFPPVGFLKDAHTLAFYNVPPGARLTLEVKERGGRLAAHAACGLGGWEYQGAPARLEPPPAHPPLAIRSAG